MWQWINVRVIVPDKEGVRIRGDMLETWHLLKDYLHIFLEKYEHVVVRHHFSKFLTKSKEHSLINCTKWWKSHNYTTWLISAVLRENVAQFLSHLGADVSHDLFKKTEVAVHTLRRNSINQDSTKEFISDLVGNSRQDIKII